MPEKGAGVSLKDFSRGSVVEGQEGEGTLGPVGAEDRRSGEGNSWLHLSADGSYSPGGHAPARGSLRTKNGKGRSLSRPA